jgi:hypothetical protein
MAGIRIGLAPAPCLDQVPSPLKTSELCAIGEKTRHDISGFWVTGRAASYYSGTGYRRLIDIALVSVLMN